MRRSSVHPLVETFGTTEISLLEFDVIGSTPQRSVENLRGHIRSLVDSVEKEATLVTVIQLLESERQGLSEPSTTTVDTRGGDNNNLSPASSLMAKLSFNYESHPSGGEAPPTPHNSNWNSVSTAGRELPSQQERTREFVETEDAAHVAERAEAKRVNEDEMERAAELDGCPQPPPPLIASRGEPLVGYGRRAAVSAESLPLNVIRSYSPPVVAKSPEEERIVRAGVMACHLFSNMDSKDQSIIVQALKRVTFPAGTDILKQDGASAEKLFLLTQGSCDVIKNGKRVHTLLECSTFGEMEMMYNLPTCVATIRSVTNCVLYTLDQYTYQNIVLAASLHKREKYEALLSNVQFLREFSDYDRMQIAEALVIKTYRQGDYIIRFGETGKWMHIIVEGEVAVVGRNIGKKCEILRLKEGEVVGELEFLFNDLTVADVIATSRRVTTAQIKRKHFELITGPIQDKLKEYIVKSGRYTHYLGGAKDRIKSELSLLGKRSKRMATNAERENAFLHQVDVNGEIILPVPKEKVFAVEKGIVSVKENNERVNVKDAVSGPDVESSSAHVLFRFPLMPIHKNSLAVIALCEDGSILLWNERMVRLTGYTAEEAIGHHICSFLLETKDQKTMHQAICDARHYTGDTEGFFDAKGGVYRRAYTFARMDGLTKVQLKLSVLPSIVSHGKDAAEIVLAVGEETNAESQQVLDKSQLLMDQISSVLSDGECNYEDRLHRIATVLNGFELTCRAMLASTEHVRVVNIRQMIGQVMMDYGAQCVSSGVAVRQRFEGLYAENAYLNAKLLPECLRYAMSNCAQHLDDVQVTITVKITENNGMDFLEIEFHDSGPGFPVDLLDEIHEGRFSEKYAQVPRVRAAMERQGGSMIIESVPGNTNVRFIVPFVPVKERLNDMLEHHVKEFDNSMSLSCVGSVTQASGNTSASSFTLQSCRRLPVWKQNFTTVVVEDTPAHRNMLCRFLWEQKHAVLPAYKLDDIEQLIDVVDILFIDPHQSIFGETNDTIDPVALLREKARRMAVVVTGVDMDGESAKAYQTAGFITLKKPCNPIQALQCIREAEEMISQYKMEDERILQTRETLSKNSRGAWKRGKLLGKGMFGEVYEATEVLTGGKMAVKEMKLNRRDVQIEQFVNEISAMCNLRHPNIIHYFYCEENKEENVIRVFMEYGSGGTLQELLKNKGNLEFKEYQSLLRDVVEGVAYIHSMNYVHGDLKTANVLLSAEGKGKIGDFGTARRVRDGELLYQMQGSPLYMSPECLAASERDEDGVLIGYSFPSDVWSLGCIALEMATNNPPFSHLKNVTGPAGVMMYVTNLHDIPDLSPLFDGPPSIVEFVSACLNPDPSKRATAAQLLHMSIFSEAPDEDMKSALKALKRAQLLHVLNNFVAFQEPVELERRKSHPPYRYKVRRETEFCDSSTEDKNPAGEEGEELGENYGETGGMEKEEHAATPTACLYRPSIFEKSSNNHPNMSSAGKGIPPDGCSHKKSGSLVRNSARAEEEAFFESSLSSFYSPENEEGGEEAAAATAEEGKGRESKTVITNSKRSSVCPQSPTQVTWRKEFVSSFTEKFGFFPLEHCSVDFMGNSMDNRRVGATVDVDSQDGPQKTPKTQHELGPREREYRARTLQDDAGLLKRVFVQPFKRSSQRSSLFKFSATRQPKRGVKNMFLVEDLQVVPERKSQDVSSPHASNFGTTPPSFIHYGSVPRQRRFAVAPHLASPSPVMPTRATEENTGIFPSFNASTEVYACSPSPCSSGTRKGVFSLSRELAPLQNALSELLERLKDIKPMEVEGRWCSQSRQAAGGMFSQKTSECREDETSKVDGVAALRDLVGRIEDEFMSLKLQISAL
ncbi:putative protein kinase [Trypanosoma cruzi]|nr:putative protein kinase [Trypanosoma cruzi]